jgi:hypothetical protein
MVASTHPHNNEHSRMEQKITTKNGILNNLPHQEPEPKNSTHSQSYYDPLHDEHDPTSHFHSYPTPERSGDKKDHPRTQTSLVGTEEKLIILQLSSNLQLSSK